MIPNYELNKDITIEDIDLIDALFSTGFAKWHATMMATAAKEKIFKTKHHSHRFEGNRFWSTLV